MIDRTDRIKTYSFNSSCQKHRCCTFVYVTCYCEVFEWQWGQRNLCYLFRECTKSEDIFNAIEVIYGQWKGH